MKEIPWTPGDRYEIGHHHHRSTRVRGSGGRRRRRRRSAAVTGKPAPGWHFLVDNDGNAKKLAEQIGFHYRYDPKQQQFAHAAAIFILTPEGRIARYLYGVRFRPMDMRFALAEASENRTTMTVEKILLFCYQYDPGKHAYVLFAANFMRAGGALTVILVAWFLFRMYRMEKRRAAALEASGARSSLKERMV